MNETANMSMPRRRRKDREPLNRVAGTLAIVPTATGNLPNPVEHFAREPTHDEIARRAYQLYEARGSKPGREWEDWCQAERELRLALHSDRTLATEEPHAAA